MSTYRSIQHQRHEEEGITVSSSLPKEFLAAGEWEALQFTAKAVLFEVPNGMHNTKQIWAPKSAVRIYMDGQYETIAVARWLIAKNNLWHTI